MFRASRERQKLLLKCQLAMTFLLLCALGCAAPLFSSYEHEQSVHCRIDNPDRDSLWDTSDENGNGVIDDNETVGPVFDFASLGGVVGGDGDSLSSAASQPAPRPQPSQPAFQEGFDSVNVTFITPPGYLEGFRNYPGGVLGESSSTAVDSRVAGLSIGFGSDSSGFSDLQTFNLFFDRIQTAPHTETHGMQVSRSHRFTKKTDKADSPKSYFEFAYGARHLRLEEIFLFDASGGVLGRTTVDMSYDNRLLGPQVGFNWQRQHNDWTIRGGSNVMLGYNFAKANQAAIIGEAFAPGAINRPVSARPNIVISTREHEELASIAELSASAIYQVRHNVALQLGYRALYMSELRHAGESIDFTLPNLGILDLGANNAWLEGLHASVEWRR